MKDINSLHDSIHDRCKSLFLALKSGLPVPYGFFIDTDNDLNFDLIKEKFNGRYLTVHAISKDYNLSKMGLFLKRFELEKFKWFLDNIRGAEGILLLSTGYEEDINEDRKEQNIFFALKINQNQILVEKVRGSSATLYHHGKKEDSFVFDLNKTIPQEIGNDIYNFVSVYNHEIMDFVNGFGDCVMEFGKINSNFFFFEAKKDEPIPFVINKDDINLISSVSEEFCGRAVFVHGIDKNKKNIILAEMPDISLSEYLSYASAFIFKEGSILSHFSIILRENEIPAFIFKDIDNLNNKTIRLTPSHPFIEVLD